MKEILAWVDLETTGTDEQYDPIVEVACVLTEGPELEVLAEYSSPIHFVLGGKVQVSAYVRAMHEQSGLWKECELAPWAPDVETAMVAMLGAWGKPHDFILAGSGVSHFDRRFLEAQMPSFTKWLRYYSVDVGVLRRSLQLIGRGDLVPAINDRKPHRALDDIRLHIEEMRHYRRVLARS